MSDDNEWTALWPLDPAVAFLNHGSYGACPARCCATRPTLRAEMEAEPVRFLGRELDDRLDAARAALGAFVGADPDDLAFVSNATGGVNAVLRSLRLAPGDELLTTDHAYQACRNTLDFVAERSGARVVTVTLPFPVASAQAIVDTVMAGVRRAPGWPCSTTSRARPPSSCRSRAWSRRSPLAGSSPLVDGAHAPGMVPARSARARRRLLQRQLPQVALHAQGLRVPPRAPRSPGRASTP